MRFQLIFEGKSRERLLNGLDIIHNNVSPYGTVTAGKATKAPASSSGRYRAEAYLDTGSLPLVGAMAGCGLVIVGEPDRGAAIQGAAERAMQPSPTPMLAPPVALDALKLSIPKLRRALITGRLDAWLGELLAEEREGKNRRGAKAAIRARIDATG